MSTSTGTAPAGGAIFPLAAVAGHLPAGLAEPVGIAVVRVVDEAV